MRLTFVLRWRVKINNRVIKPLEGELYSSACARVLEKYLSLNGGREEFERTPEFIEAMDHYRSWQHPIQKKYMFGQEMIDALSEIEKEKQRGKFNKPCWR